MTTQTQNQIKHTFSLSRFLTFSLSHFHTCKGVTILELLVALVITALLGATLATIFQTSMKAWQRGEASTQRCQPARIALQKMSEDIRSAILLSTTDNPSPKDVRFVGENDYNTYGDRLSFISLASPNLAGGASPECDFAEIGYYVKAAPETGLVYLFRRWGVGKIPDTDVTAGGSSPYLALYVKELNFSYYGTIWGDSWDDDASLPKKVWIELTVQDDVTGVKKEERISTIVYLPAR